MKFVRFEKDGERYGILKDRIIQEIKSNFLIKNFAFTDNIFHINEVKLLSPVVPSKIIGVGLNYIEHIEELNHKKPEVPMLFLKPPSATINPFEPIVYPKNMSNRVDYEGELCVVIGKKTKNIKTDEAKDYIFGYTIINDVTARDLQEKDGQWTRSKGFDTFAPIGPLISDEADPLNLHITTFVNNKKVQDSYTSYMIFNVYELVSFISSIMTLFPGDIIASGTPKGVGSLKIGDNVKIVIDKIGKLENSVVGG